MHACYKKRRKPKARSGRGFCRRVSQARPEPRKADTSTHLKQVFADNHATLKTHPEQAVATFAAESRGHADLHRQVRIRDFSIDVDEPPALGGTDLAANPVEYALAALATCQEITYRLHAAALGIPLKEVSVKLEGDVDLLDVA